MLPAPVLQALAVVEPPPLLLPAAPGAARLGELKGAQRGEFKDIKES